MSIERFPDIEVYVKGIDTEALLAWLHATLHATLTPEGKGHWRGEGQGENGATIPCMIMEKAADGFTSLSLDSDATPWPRDIDCARALHTSLGGEVRCSPGGWLPGEEPECYIRLINGEESTLIWQ